MRNLWFQRSLQWDCLFRSAQPEQAGGTED
jgi:hypothetical protein